MAITIFKDDDRVISDGALEGNVVINGSITGGIHAGDAGVEDVRTRPGCDIGLDPKHQGSVGIKFDIISGDIDVAVDAVELEGVAQDAGDILGAGEPGGGGVVRAIGEIERTGSIAGVIESPEMDKRIVSDGIIVVGVIVGGGAICEPKGLKSGDGIIVFDGIVRAIFEMFSGVAVGDIIAYGAVLGAIEVY